MIYNERSAKINSYYKMFNSSDWTENESDVTISIPQSEHKLIGNYVFAEAATLSDNRYQRNTWAGIETYATVDDNHNIIIHTTSPFDGAVLLIG